MREVKPGNNRLNDNRSNGVATLAEAGINFRTTTFAGPGRELMEALVQRGNTRGGAVESLSEATARKDTSTIAQIAATMARAMQANGFSKS